MSGAAGPNGHVDVNVDVNGKNHGHEPHIVPIPIYLAVFAALMLGTYATVWAAGKDFGALNTVVALGIAVTKATLVILFFMHVKYSARLTQLVVGVAIAFLALLIGGTLNDYYSPHLDGKLHPASISRE